MDSQAVRHEGRGGGTAERLQEAGTLLTSDGDPNFPPPSQAAERGAVLTLGRPRGCLSPRRRPSCLAAVSPAHRKTEAREPSLPVQRRGRGVCVQGEIPSLLSILSAQHHPVPCSASFPHLSIMLSPPRHSSQPQHPQHEGAPLPIPARHSRPQRSDAACGVCWAPRRQPEPLLEGQPCYSPLRKLSLFRRFSHLARSPRAKRG